MHRRGLMGMLAALALAVFTGVRPEAADMKSKSSCACCGAGCLCRVPCPPATLSETARTCDANAKAGQACDCCAGAVCCTASSAKTNKVEKAEKSCCSTKAKQVVTAVR
jgi:hypothetical protein